MHTLISMLRGINVSGQKTIRMADLKAIYESLGYIQVTTYVQSGNVVFDCANQRKFVWQLRHSRRTISLAVYGSNRLWQSGKQAVGNYPR